jgi:hypothetical protein
VLVLNNREAMQEGCELEHARDRTERRDARENRRLLLEVGMHGCSLIASSSRDKKLPP